MNKRISLLSVPMVLATLGLMMVLIIPLAGNGERQVTFLRSWRAQAATEQVVSKYISWGWSIWNFAYPSVTGSVDLYATWIPCVPTPVVVCNSETIRVFGVQGISSVAIDTTVPPVGILYNGMTWQNVATIQVNQGRQLIMYKATAETQIADLMLRSAHSAAPVSTCGNGIVEVQNGESCDDRNLNNGDGCSAQCTVEFGYVCTGSPSRCVLRCGNGIVEVQNGESCDDRNLNNGDGCSSQCRVESGYVCTGSPSQCILQCGNGVLDAGESCDDGDLDNGDGCSSQCRVESGYVCTGSPSTCVTRCGDGITAGAEQCDDGAFNGRQGRCNLFCDGSIVGSCGDNTYERGELCTSDKALQFLDYNKDGVIDPTEGNDILDKVIAVINANQNTKNMDYEFDFYRRTPTDDFVISAGDVLALSNAKNAHVAKLGLLERNRYNKRPITVGELIAARLKHKQTQRPEGEAMVSTLLQSYQYDALAGRLEIALSVHPAITKSEIYQNLGRAFTAMETLVNQGGYDARYDINLDGVLSGNDNLQMINFHNDISQYLP